VKIQWNEIPTAMVAGEKPFSNNLKLDEMKHISNFHEKCRTGVKEKNFCIREMPRNTFGKLYIHATLLIYV